MKETKDHLNKQWSDMGRMDFNMNKMYKHYKGHLSDSNMWLIDVEKQLSTLNHARRLQQAQQGNFDFGQNQLPQPESSGGKSYKRRWYS
jgi:hypothetical protein